MQESEKYYKNPHEILSRTSNQVRCRFHSLDSR
jgi:hypothetical protein